MLHLRKMNILDVGTGPGFFAIILTLAGHNVVGIDITEEMIQRAKVNAQRRRFPRIHSYG